MKTKKTSWWVKLFWLVIGVGFIGGLLLGVMILVTYPKLPSMDELKNYQPKLPLQVYSEDGVLLGQFGTEHRIYIDYESTPKLLVEAIISAEDERFFEHGGIDFLGIIRAAVVNVVSGHIQSGASTITMQVARNFFLTTQKTFSRKFNEALLAYKIEHSLTKEQILSLYINQIYLGQRAYGFAEASETYFGKPLERLTIAEYAVLAGLPKAPSAYNPVVNPKRSKDRELYVLGRMLKHNYITQAEYDEAVNQKIVVVKGQANNATDAGGFVAEMTRLYLYPTYGEAIYTQGFKVYTTINSKLQQAAYNALRNGVISYDSSRGYRGPEKRVDLTQNTPGESLDDVAINQLDGINDYGDLLAAVVLKVDKNSLEVILRNAKHLSFKDHDLDFVRKFINQGGNKEIIPGSIIRVYHNNSNAWQISEIPEAQGALVAVDPQNGAIKALMGGFDFGLNSYNHVTQAMRQPGSSFKPFIYSAALNKGFTAETIINDSPVCFPGGAQGSLWCPRNDDDKFLGPISLRQALTLSRNLVTVKIINAITPRYVIDYVTHFGFEESQFQPYLTLGLGANEATPLQMAKAYAVFANGGYLVEPYFISKITDSNGKLLAKTQAVNIKDEATAIDPRNAFIMNSILQDVAKYGTGARAWRAMHRPDVAGKTGTTTEAKDVWFDGYTPGLVAITWMGYDQPRSLGAHAYGANIALPIWIDFMQVALNQQPILNLPMPEGISVESGGTWKGDNEYYITGGLIGKSDASGTETGAILESMPLNNDASAPENNSKPASIDDIINNIQD